MLPITVLIPTLDEADNLSVLLPLLQGKAGEILVADSYSKDATVELALEHGARIVQRVYDYPAAQKNWAIPQARYEWVLIFDADERPTPELWDEIRDKIERPDGCQAYWIRRLNHFGGRRLRYSGWQGDRVIRLLRRDQCRYTDRRVHEEIDTRGLRIGHLRAPMLHFTYRDMDHFLAKMQRYSRWAAQDLHERGRRRVNGFHLWLKPAFRFFKHFVWQGGFLDGRTGLTVSAIMAWGVFLRYAYLMEIQNKKNPS